MYVVCTQLRTGSSRAVSFSLGDFASGQTPDMFGAFLQTPAAIDDKGAVWKSPEFPGTCHADIICTLDKVATGWNLTLKTPEGFTPTAGGLLLPSVCCRYPPPRACLANTW